MFIQDAPCGEPLILPPSADKIEVNKLQEDIPKFKQWISSSSSAVWDVFLERELQDLLSTHEAPWVMQKVFDRVESSQEHDSDTPQEVDSNLMTMIEASLNPPCRVSVHGN